LVDLDGDGDQDLLSGSWPGELFLFRREADGSFAAPIMLQDENDDYINIGGGIRDSGDRILITGNAEFEKTDAGMFAVYHGKRIACTPEKGVAITGTASAVHACDWDDDGDLDLLVGEIGGRVYLIPNLGSRTHWQFGRERPLTAGGVPIRVDGDAGPFVADWDQDGDLDLLVGDGKGSVTLFANEGTRAGPQLARGRTLIEGPGYRDEPPTAPAPGIRAKICATDWNGDGKLDLLVGDFASLKPDVPELTAEQQAAQDLLRAEFERLSVRHSELADRLFGDSREKDPDTRTALEAEWKVVSPRVHELRQQLPQESESHGWIWLYLRR
jgi:FG-GAP-like repeat